MAQTMGSRADAPKAYVVAGTSFAEIDVVKRLEILHRKREEGSRQEEEKGMLAKAYRIEKTRFEAEWARRIEAEERACDQKEMILKEVWKEVFTPAVPHRDHMHQPHISRYLMCMDVGLVPEWCWY